jgi:hypothetical protein
MRPGKNFIPHREDRRKFKGKRIVFILLPKQALG